MSATENGNVRGLSLAAGGTSVASLACARFEDTLAEGTLAEGALDATAEAHRLSCESCDALARDLDGLTTDISAATAPAALPDGFAEGVLRRAELLAGRPLAPAASMRKPWRQWMYAGVGFATAAGLAAVLWLGSQQAGQVETLDPLDRARAARAHQVVTPALGAGSVATPERFVLPTPAPVREFEQPAPVTPAEPNETTEPVIPEAPVVPEQSVNLHAELGQALRREVRRVDGCPKRSGGTLRLTFAVDETGKIHDRTVLSSVAAAAHHCANVALDRLLLPPQKRSTRVTVDLSW